MSSDVYIQKICDCCGKTDSIYIGHKSAGWVFAVMVYRKLGLDTWEKWKTYIQEKINNGYEIKYNTDIISLNELIKIVENPEKGNRIFSQKWLSKNHAEPGPHGLARRKINPNYDYDCIGHGKTWDLVVGLVGYLC